MPTKEEIFENINLYTAEQIVSFIKQGVVTVWELEDSDNTRGQYSSDMRDKVSELLNDNEPEDWQTALDTNTVEAYQYYLNTYPDGKHRDEARQRKRELEKEGPVLEPDNWASVDKENLSALQTFMKNYPTSPHFNEAKRLANKIINKRKYKKLIGIDMKALIGRIKNIQADKKVLNPDETIFNLIVSNLEKTNNNITMEEVVQAMTEDINLLSAGVVHKLYDEGYLTEEDFESMNADMDFVQYMLTDVKPQKYAEPAKLSQINRPCTEIYFWGIPSSGKSCALGGILSVANSGTIAPHMEKDNQCQGYDYMSRLMLQFKNDGSVGTLPEGTSTTATYEMGFNLTDKDGKIHPITCIDLAGEMIRCMYKNDSGLDLPDAELKTLDTLTRILVDKRTKNRKMHFFVIEYGGDDRLYEGLPQKTYLEAAVSYIKTTQIFSNDTDAIFILVTKVDKAPQNAPINEVVEEYLKKYYLGFINGLKSICELNEINGGKIEILPFSLGTVCFQNYCKFDDEAAVMVVKKILERTPGYKPDKINKLFEKFRQ